jgi:hypothetical protein
MSTDRPVFGVAPTSCPYGHTLGPGQAQPAWEPCKCEWSRRLRGHRTVRCRECERNGMSTVFYDPPHQRTPEDVRVELLWVRAHVERLELAGADQELIAPYRRTIVEGERTAEALRGR